MRVTTARHRQLRPLRPVQTRVPIQSGRGQARKNNAGPIRVDQHEVYSGGKMPVGAWPRRHPTPRVNRVWGRLVGLTVVPCVVGVAVVGNPGLGLLKTHRPRVCNATAFRSCLRRLQGTFPRIRLRCFRSGVRNRVVSHLRLSNFSTSTVVLGTKNCARASVTVTSTVTTVRSPMVRIRVSGVFTHRPRQHASLVSTGYVNSVSKFNLGSC